MKEAEDEFDLESLASFPGSGRSVGAVTKTAIALCSYRECALTQELLQECIINFLSFHEDLSKEGVSMTWDDGARKE